MRKLIIIIVAALLGIAALAAALLFFVDVNQYRAPVQTRLEKSLHRSVTLGAMNLKWIPLAIQINDVSVGENPEFHAQSSFLTAREMYVRVGLLPLLHKAIEVDSLRIVRPQIELIKNKAGQWNFETLGGGGSAGGGSASVVIGELSIEDGTVGVTDQAAAQARSQYDHIDVALHNFAPGKHFELEANVHLPGSGKETLAVKANGASISDLNGTVAIQAVSLAGLRAFLGAAGAELSDVALTGDGSFQTTAGVMSGKASIAIADARIKENGHLDFEFKSDRQSGVLSLPSITAKLGPLTVSGRAQTKTNVVPAPLDVEVHTDHAPLAEFIRLAKMAGAAEGIEGTGTLSLNVRVQGTSAAPSYSGSGAIRSASIKLPSLEKPLGLQTADLQFAQDQVKLQNLAASIGNTHLHGSASVRDFAKPDLLFAAEIDSVNVTEAQTWIAPGGSKPGTTAKSSRPVNGSGVVTIGRISYNDLVLTEVKADCKLENGVIRLAPLTAKLFGGDESGAITIDNRTNPPSYAIQSRLTNIDENKLLSATSAMKNVLYGTLSGNADVHLTPVAGQEMARGLNGTMQVLLVKGKLTGISVMNEISRVGKFLGYTLARENSTNISKMAGTFKIQNGLANTDDLELEFDGGSLTGAGAIGLADQTLNLKLTTILTKGTSEQAGGSKIGGFMSTALANSKGELVIPAVVKGTFARPQFEPDTAQMAKMKLGGLLPTQANPTALVKQLPGLFDAVTGKKDAVPTGAQKTPDIKSPGILDVLDSLRKKKPN